MTRRYENMPKILNIITNPNPVLRRKSKVVDMKKDDLKKMSALCDDMTETMFKSDGVGLAAPQIGENIRAIVINTKDGPIFMINPEITSKSLLKEFGEEGCLSVPHFYGQVKRHKKITCQFCRLEGSKIKMKAEGLLARVIQHETDHLDGILFIDKAKKIVEEKPENKKDAK